jgi:hypothetical protein
MMRGFFIGDAHPIIVEAGSRRLESRNQVPRKVNGIELDMGKGVEQCDAASFGAGLPPPRHVAREQ